MSSAGAAAAPRREPEPEVLLHGELGEEPPPLRDERDTARAIALGRSSAERGHREADLAARERDEPHDRVERRRLAGAVRADQADDLASSTVNETPRTAATVP